jgi:L-ascorbate metabolism protein UlaG (beta-lactamase superfamily)
MVLFSSSVTADLAFLPIGDNFTMGPEDAKLAAEWLRAKQVVPVHYNTFLQFPDQFHIREQRRVPGVENRFAVNRQ